MTEALKELFGWSGNPFMFRIMPELFVGYSEEVSKLASGILNGSKFSLLLGPTGSGKTTLLKHISSEMKNSYDHVIYLPKPPKDPNDWTEIFSVFTKGFLSFLRRGNTSIYNLGDTINKKLNGSRCLLLIDECHESSQDSLEWLRTLTDHIDNLYIVMAGLPVFESKLKSDLESFMRRVSTKIELTNLTKSETRELIKRRIESMGGDDIKPFTHETMDYIYENTAGFPREILRFCNELVQKAAARKISTIDSDFLRESAGQERRVSLESIEILPERQRMILETLSQKGELSPTEIVNMISTDDYKNKDNALRSVNNLLRRLMADGFVTRKKLGKTYKYSVSSRFRTMFVQA